MPTLSVELGSLECCNPKVAAYRRPSYPLQPQYRTTNDAAEFVSSHPIPGVRKTQQPLGSHHLHARRTRANHIASQQHSETISTHLDSVAGEPWHKIRAKAAQGRQGALDHTSYEMLRSVPATICAIVGGFASTNNGSGRGRVAWTGSRFCGRGWLTIVL